MKNIKKTTTNIVSIIVVSTGYPEFIIIIEIIMPNPIIIILVIYSIFIRRVSNFSFILISGFKKLYLNTANANKIIISEFVIGRTYIFPVNSLK